MTRVGFIGLGLMGNPMSKNLVKGGHEVYVWNRTPSRADEAVAAGAKRASSPKDAASRADVIVTMVADSKDVEAVILGPGGIVEGARPDSVVIDMSTISPTVTKEIAARLKEKGIQMLDAPVSGGVIGATNGTLSIMIGGDKAVIERCRPILEAMGKRITHCGPNGMGQVIKLANQIVGNGTLAAVCEGMVYAAKAGADPDALLSALGGGAANSWMLENLAPRMYNGNFAPGFMIDMAQKDMRLVLESAEDLNVPIFLSAVITQLFRTAQQMGMGREGTQALIKVMENMAGVEARRAK
ncbi:MAG: NAD(P)-dependent oxidoreductase [SAR202 cluster bacterium]|nr:NAD(P)-dependent oxidoreductase [SAR202 cluster bacterium]